MSIPSNLSYTAEHEWLDRDGANARVGVTAYAAEALGDIVYVDLPEVGAKLNAGEACGELESTKSVSDLYAPTDGTVVEVNAAVQNDPGLLNSDPFGEGWLFVMEVSGEPELLDAAAYGAVIGE